MNVWALWRRVRLAVALVGALSLLPLAGLVAPAEPAAAPAAPAVHTGSATAAPAPVPVYLALGDSIASGENTTVEESTDAYVNDIYATYAPQVPNLTLINLGCAGATVEELISSGPCSVGLTQYPWTSSDCGSLSPCSQLQFAKHVIEDTAQYHVLFVTIDVGGDSLSSCGVFVNQSTLATCLNKISAELLHVLSELQKAAQTAGDPAMRIFGMNLYDPLLGTYPAQPGESTYCSVAFPGLLQYPQICAERSVSVLAAFNDAEQEAYHLAALYPPGTSGPTAPPSVQYVNVARIFKMQSQTLIPPNGWPRNVAVTCTWTYACLNGFDGYNVHPNPAGHWAIAQGFTTLIGYLGSPSASKTPRA